MSKKPIIYFLVEVKARELEAKTLLALEAAKRGYRAVLGNQDHLKKLIRKDLLPNGVYYYKNLSPGKEDDLGSIAKKGFSIVSQDEESGLLDFSYEKFLSFRSSEETMGIVSHVYCWGEHDKVSWRKRYPGREESIFATGSPRVDFWRDDFSAYYQDEVASLKERFGNFVLIPANFPLSNGYMTVEQRVEQGVANGSIVNDEDKNMLIKSIEDTRKMRACFVEIIKKLSRRFPEINFVVRPHPVEKVHVWESELGSYENAHVVFEGGVSKWVRASKAILHNGCTTSLEARFCSVPSIAYTPFKSPINREVPNAVSLICESEEEVFVAISDIMNKGEESAARTIGEGVLSNRFANFEGEPAFKRIISKVEEVDVESTNYPRRSLLAAKYVKRYQFGRYIRKKRGRHGHGDRKFSGLSEQELQNIQQRLSSIYPHFSSCKIDRYMGDIFIIEDVEY